MGDQHKADQDQRRDPEHFDGEGDLADLRHPLALPGSEIDPASLSTAITPPPRALDAATLEAYFEQLPREEQDRFLKGQLKKLLTTKEAAEELGLTPDAVKKAAQRGEVGTTLGRNHIFTRQEIAAHKETERRRGGRPPGSGRS